MLHAAASRGHTSCVRALLEADSSVQDRGDIVGKTALHLACARGALGCVVALLASGASTEAADRLHRRRPLHACAAGGHWEACCALLSAGACADAADRSGRTPLHIAAERGHKTVVGALLEAGADAHAKDAARALAIRLLLWRSLALTASCLPLTIAIPHTALCALFLSLSANAGWDVADRPCGGLSGRTRIHPESPRKNSL